LESEYQLDMRTRQCDDLCKKVEELKKDVHEQSSLTNKVQELEKDMQDEKDWLENLADFMEYKKNNDGDCRFPIDDPDSVRTFNFLFVFWTEQYLSNLFLVLFSSTGICFFLKG